MSGKRTFGIIVLVAVLSSLITAATIGLSGGVVSASAAIASAAIAIGVVTGGYGGASMLRYLDGDTKCPRK